MRSMLCSVLARPASARGGAAVGPWAGAAGGQSPATSRASPAATRYPKRMLPPLAARPGGSGARALLSPGGPTLTARRSGPVARAWLSVVAAARRSRRAVAAEAGQGVVDEARVHHAVEVHLAGQLAAPQVPALRLAQALHVHPAVRVRPGGVQARDQPRIADGAGA